MTSYGFSVALTSEQTIKSAYDGLDEIIKYKSYYFGKNSICKYGYINKSEHELILKLYFNKQLIVVLGNESFIKENLDLNFYCNW